MLYSEKSETENHKSKMINNILKTYVAINLQKINLCKNIFLFSHYFFKNISEHIFIISLNFITLNFQFYLDSISRKGQS